MGYDGVVQVVFSRDDKLGSVSCIDNARSILDALFGILGACKVSRRAETDGPNVFLGHIRRAWNDRPQGFNGEVSKRQRHLGKTETISHNVFVSAVSSSLGFSGSSFECIWGFSFPMGFLQFTGEGSRFNRLFLHLLLFLQFSSLKPVLRETFVFI